MAVNPLPVQFKSLLPGQEGCVFFSGHLTLNLLMTNIVASKWQTGFNSAFKGYMKNQQIHQLFIQFINYVLGTLPEDGNVMPKHADATTHN